MASDNISKDKLNLRTDSESDQDIVMMTASNANIQDDIDLNFDQILNLCFKCTNYVMTNRYNVAEIIPQHQCVVRDAASRLKNLGFCMHKIIDESSVIYNKDLSNYISMPSLRCYQDVAPSGFPIQNLSSVVSVSHNIHMLSADNHDETRFDSHHPAFMTSTPKSVYARLVIKFLLFILHII